jgi:putative ABC transport system permease protein
MSTAIRKRRSASVAGLLGAILLIVKIMSSTVVERSREIGVLKAVGWTQREIQRQLRMEVFLQALAGGILGIFAGYAVSILLGGLST